MPPFTWPPYRDPQEETRPLSQISRSIYPLPADQPEYNRLTFQHYLCSQVLRGLSLAPLSQPLPKILDVGCGTGIWVKDLARRFPRSTVVGIDPSDRFFPTSSIPSNCCFRVGDVLQRLPFLDDCFSFVHQRFLFTAIPAARWPQVLAELARVTTPGGWVEVMEMDEQMQHPGPLTSRLQASFSQVHRALGFDGEIIRQLEVLFAQQGFQSVTKRVIPVPVGRWGGRLGGVMQRDLLAAIQAFRGPYCRFLPISEEAFDDLVEQLAHEWEQTCSSCTFVVVYGKRGAP
jgi:SAM-dependent methyltransferase